MTNPVLHVPKVTALILAVGAQSIFPQFACSALRFSTAIGKPTVYFGLCADSFVKLIQVAEEQKREAVICMSLHARADS